MTLEELLEQPIVGNAMSDAGLMRQIDDFITNPDNSMDQKVQALDFLGYRVMGLSEADYEPSTEADVNDYIKECCDVP